jgi:hypothetical protein
MADFVQIVPLHRADSTLPVSLMAIDNAGRLWYGALNYGGTARDGGPDLVTWRLVESR